MRLYLFFLLIFCLENSALPKNISKTTNQSTKGKNEIIPLIIDHDGAIDDFSALTLMFSAPEIKVEAVTVCPGDSYKEPAIRATQKFLDYLGAHNITIAAGDYSGLHPFPDLWRKVSFQIEALPILANVPHDPSNRVINESAATQLVRLLSGDKKFTLLTTGPFTHLYQALLIDPSIKRNINHLYAMGGAFNVKGGINEKNQPTAAEWNIYNNPEAAGYVIKSGIRMTLVPMDATNKVPITHDFIRRLQNQSTYRVSRLMYETLNLATPYIDLKGYYFWDTLTAAIILRPDIIKTDTKKVKIITEGVSEGRSVEENDGTPIEVVIDADKEKFENLILDKYKK